MRTGGGNDTLDGAAGDDLLESEIGDDILADPVETRYGFANSGDLSTVTVTQGAAGIRHAAYQYDPARGWLTPVTNRVTWLEFLHECMHAMHWFRGCGGFSCRHRAPRGHRMVEGVTTELD